MRKRLVLALLALTMGMVGSSLLTPPNAAQAATSCRHPFRDGRCCACGPSGRAAGLDSCTDGCPSCGGFRCAIAVDPTRPTFPLWGD